MTVKTAYRILLWTPKLRGKQCEPVTDFGSSLKELVDRMIVTMKANNGIGLAAPQIGIFKRLAVIHLEQTESTESLLVLCNPVILEETGKQLGNEGCLSIPGFREKIWRPNKIKFVYRDIEGRDRSMEAEGLLARAVCHEVGHLNGEFYIDKLSSLKRNMILTKYRKRYQGAELMERK